MDYNKLSKIRAQLRDMLLDSIANYLDNVEVTDWLSVDDIEQTVELRMSDSVSMMLQDILEEVADEVFDEIFN